MSSINGSNKIGIEVKVTDRCNQNCFYCVNRDAGSGGKDLDHALFVERLLEWRRCSRNSAWEIDEVRITGGEPLVNDSGVMAIVKACRSAGMISGINTNGSLLTKDLASRLKDAGMSVAKISLDTLEADTFKRIRGPEALRESSLNGIRVAVDAGFQVIVRFTLCALNKDELVRCYAYAASAGASRFQVKPLIPAGRGRTSEQRLDRRALSRVIHAFSKDIPETPTVPEILCLPPEEAFGLPAKACGSIRKIYVSASGQVSACNYLPAGPFGELSSQSLEDILHARAWHTPAVRYHQSRVLAGCPQYEK